MARTRSARGVTLKSARELNLMREAGQIVAEALNAMAAEVAPGITTAELDAIAADIISGSGAIASFTGVPAMKDGVQDFPAAITASINDEIVHGIPGPHQLREGDIVSLDVGVIYQGYHGDAAITVPVGEVDDDVQRLLDVTLSALKAGISQARPTGRLWDVIRAIQTTVESNGFNVIRQYQGHGIGRSMHEPPSVPNFLGYGGYSPKNYELRPGVTMALEPMVVVGDWETKVLSDGWTVVTADGKMSAHFEHTIAVTQDGPEILTPWE